MHASYRNFSKRALVTPPCSLLYALCHYPEQIASMDRATRQYAEDRYDVHKVNAIMLKEMELSREGMRAET